MSHRFRMTVALSALLATSLVAASEAPVNPDVEAAKGIIQKFASQLQGELKQAIEAAGPVEAIKVCKERAPAIAADLSAESGWSVRRVSLKLRNAKLDTPDAWEAGVLESFAKRQANGEELKTMAHAETLETADGKSFRFMKAIETFQPCLTCHGSEIKPEVAAALDEHYPDDQARGFKAGDLRGAFSLIKPL